MKKLVFFILVLSTSVVFSQTKSFWFEYQGTKKQDFQQLIASSFTSQNQNGFGFTSFALLSAEWGELYFGPMYGKTFKNDLYLEINISVGIETNKIPLRTATYLYGKKNKFWFFLNYEDGGSGDWYLGIIEYQFKKIGIGIQAQKFATHGLRFNYKLKNFSLWSVYGMEPINGSKSVTFGIRYNL